MSDTSTSETTPKNSVSEQENVLSGRFISMFKNLKLTRSSKEGVGVQPSFLGHCLLAGAQLIFISGTFLVLNWVASDKAYHWLKLTEVSSLPQETNILPLESVERARLEAQFKEIQLRIERHAEVMIYFYKQYFISLSMSSGLALVAGISIFFISRDGWSKANNALINIFIVTSSAALLYNQLPGLFKQDINLEANRELYLSYTSLKDEVLSYMATGGIAGSDPTKPELFSPVDSKQFIHAIDKRLAELNQIPIEFDATQIITAPDFRAIDPQSGNSLAD